MCCLCNLNVNHSHHVTSQWHSVEYRCSTRLAVLLLHVVQGEENFGVVMVFTIISAVQEKLTHLVESAEEHRAAEKERLEKEAEVAEQVYCLIYMYLNVRVRQTHFLNCA